MKTFQAFLEQEEPLLKKDLRTVAERFHSMLVQAIQDAERKGQNPHWLARAKEVVRMGEEQGLGEPSEEKWGPIDVALRLKP